MKKKFLFIFLIVILFISVVLENYVNAETSNSAVYGTVSALSGTPDITDDGQGNIIITFTKTQINELKWVKHDDNGTERGKNGWWLGFRVTAPDDADLDTSLYSEEKDTPKPFSQVLDTVDGKYCSFWVLLDENILASHNTTWDAYKYTFNWQNKAGAAEPTVQTLNVTIRIDPDDVVLSNIPENEDNADKIIKVTVDGKIFRILEGESLSDLPQADKSELEKLKVREGYTFEGFFKTVDGQDVEVKETDPSNEDTILTSKFTKIEIPPETNPENPPESESENPPEIPPESQPETPPAKDETPKTGESTMNIELLVLGITMIALVGTVVAKKNSK